MKVQVTGAKNKPGSREVAKVLAWRKWRTDERGVTAIEYAIIAGLVSCAIFIAVQVLGTDLGDVLTSVGDQLGSTPPPAAPNGAHGGHGA